MLIYRNARVVLLTVFVFVLVLAACAGEHSPEQDLEDKARIVIDAEFGSLSVRGEGRQNLSLIHI